MALIVSSGFPPFEALSGTFYVVLPYLFEVIFMLLQIPIIYTICAKDPIREYDYVKSVQRIRPYYFVIALNAAIGFLASMFYCTVHGFEPLKYSLIYLFCKFATVAVSLFLFRFLQDLKYKEI